MGKTMKTKLKSIIMNRKLVAIILTAAMVVSATALTPVILPNVYIPVISDLLGNPRHVNNEPLPFRCGD
ncbi:MAG: hypothetical protein FWH07_02110, partial [Oscillospiraceae bacterium]|nr:hypothetical protein [Oscillospiraceae bacterium]